MMNRLPQQQGGGATARGPLHPPSSYPHPPPPHHQPQHPSQHPHHSHPSQQPQQQQPGPSTAPPHPRPHHQHYPHPPPHAHTHHPPQQHHSLHYPQQQPQPSTTASASAGSSSSTTNTNTNTTNNPSSSGSKQPPHPTSTSSSQQQQQPQPSSSSSSHSQQPQHQSSQQQQQPRITIQELYQLVQELTDPERRKDALAELSRCREDFPDLALILWYSYGTIAALLQEIVPIYPLLSPPQLTTQISNRCCNALALLQCVASHPETRGLFLNSHLGLFLYPFLNTSSKSKPYEYLRLTSLGVIGALVKQDNSQVISFLLQTEIIPLCLRIMDSGSELSRTVATFIIQKILLDPAGLRYVCATYDRFTTVSNVLKQMVIGLVQQPSQRLLKHIIACYLRLSDFQKACEELDKVLPSQLRDDTFGNLLKNDELTRRWLEKLLTNIENARQQQQQQQQQQVQVQQGHHPQQAQQYPQHYPPP